MRGEVIGNSRGEGGMRGREGGGRCGGARMAERGRMRDVVRVLEGGEGGVNEVKRVRV